MNQIKRHGVALLAGAALWGWCGASHGLTMGRATSHAILGEALAFTVPVRPDAGERLEGDCIAAEVFFGDVKVSGGVSVKLVTDASGASQIKVGTQAPIAEPVVTVNVLAGCQTRVKRGFVVLATPPKQGTPSASASPALAALAATSASSASKAPSGADQRARQEASKKAAPAETGKLELDPAVVEALVAPKLRLGTTLAMAADPDQASPEVLARRASAAAHWRALQANPDQLASDQSRLQELEDKLTQLQVQQAQILAANTAASAPASAAKAVAVAVPPPPPSPVPAASAQPEVASTMQDSRTMGLIGLAVALLVGGAYVFLRGRSLRGRVDDAWWQAQAAGETQAPPLPQAEPHDPHPTTVEFVHVPENLLRQAGHGGGTSSSSTPSMAAVPATAAFERSLPTSSAPGAQFTSMFASLHAQEPEPLRVGGVAAEDLIDLEQQADFFEVLGQHDAAIDLLDHYTTHTQGASPLPFLKLLEIHRRLGHRDAYERVRQAFDARFHARAPAWEDDMQQGHSLADYPAVVDSLQALWPTPTQAMAVLDRALTRPTEADGTFDLPAYRELLMLYAVARDLAEQGGSPEQVDVWLPLAGDPGEQAAEASVTLSTVPNTLPSTLPNTLPDVWPEASPLMATRPLTASGEPLSPPEVDVDLALQDDEPAGATAARPHKP